MTNFEDFKQKAKDTMESIADKSVEFYKLAEEKTKLFAKMTKLGTEITLEKGNVRKLYREIGKKYYELHKTSPEDALAQACAEITITLDCIAEKQKELDELKKSLGEKDKTDCDTEGKDIEVEIIIEDAETTAHEDNEMAMDEEPVLTADDPTAANEDVNSSHPPEFKL